MAHLYGRPLGIIGAVALVLTLVFTSPAQAGEPDKTVGGVDVNHYVCAAADHRIVDLENDAFSSTSDIGGLLTFDPDKTVDLEKLKDECKEAEDDYNLNFNIEAVQQSRVEGYVIEFHPDPSAPGGWLGVFSRDVPVVIFGPGFEVSKGSEKDGFFYFDSLGAGPVTFNLRLPPDAHPINPNITVVTNGFALVTTRIYLGFYRGDGPAPDPEAIVSPDSVQLPPGNYTFEDCQADSSDSTTCSYTGMPSVGGVLPRQTSLFSIVLAVILVITLPAAGILTLRRSRFEN
jgi:hypothetical protein